jgi:two-component system chemotaxis sensor kinase CheA
LRALRNDLHDSRRLLGPPRPWGPPAAALTRLESTARRLGAAAEEVEQESLRCRRGAILLGASAGDIRREVGQVRRTTLTELLTRIGAGIERIATREGRHVRVQVSSAEVPVDREIAARLADPLMQLARNARAHGIEAPEDRVRRGKPPVGVIQLGAERDGDFLRLSCEDDGRGVDIESIRLLAVERGSVSAEAARNARDDELLALLFVPGFTTRAEADLLAGRGVGLDLSLALVRRLGGTIRLESRAGAGLRATIEVPSERWLVEVLWLSASGWELALPVTYTGKLTRVDPERPPIHLATCLGLPPRSSPPLSLELALSGIPTVSIGVDAVGDVEECNIRPLPGLAAAAGPFSGAIVRGDGALYLALDPALLAVRAWSLA